MLTVLGVALSGAVSSAQPAAPAAPQDVSITQPPASPATDFTLGTEGHVFRSADARGKFLAIHFLSANQPDVSPLTDYASGERTLAGFAQVFVTSGSPEQLAAVISAAPKELAEKIYRDPDEHLSAQFRLPPRSARAAEAIEATIVLDPDGNEILRRTAKDGSHQFSFSQFFSAFNKASADAQTRQANVGSDPLSLQGYDPVGYVAQNQALPGDPRITSMYRGLLYRFTSELHRKTFNDAPQKYVPAYGGWCATAMAKGEKVEVDPKDFKVTGGRLFLFYNGFWGDARKDWLKDESGLTTKADEYWHSITTRK